MNGGPKPRYRIDVSLMHVTEAGLPDIVADGSDLMRMYVCSDRVRRRVSALW